MFLGAPYRPKGRALFRELNSRYFNEMLNIPDHYFSCARAKAKDLAFDYRKQEQSTSALMESHRIGDLKMGLNSTNEMSQAQKFRNLATKQALSTY